MRKAVFFDRDGTLIVDKIYLNDPSQIHYLDSVFDSLKAIQQKGFEFIIVTNQSGIANGSVLEENLLEIHKIMKDDFAKHNVRILDFFYAPYLTSSNHYYRKPSIGMLTEACLIHNISPENSWIVGDRMTDVEAGHRCGMKTILLSDLENPKDFPYAPPEFKAANLNEVANCIIQET